MPVKSPSPSEINQKNKTYWEQQHQDMKRRLDDPALRTEALKQIQDDHRRQVPVYNQRTLERALLQAEESVEALIPVVRKNQARHAARAPRFDPLRHLIETLVAESPAITCTLLLSKLSQHVGSGVIEDIDDETIGYVVDGQGKSLPISRLKDRLTRARKKVSSR